jgi:hypothetical protein
MRPVREPATANGGEVVFYFNTAGGRIEEKPLNE